MVTSAPVTTLVRLVDLSALEVIVRIHERNLGRISVGDSVTARFPNLDRSVTGAVVRIGYEIDVATRTAEVVARVDNSTLNLPSGLFTELELRPAGNREAILLPVAAVHDPDGRAHCFVVIDNRAQRHPIEVLRVDGDRLEVVQGLEPGEHVIIESQRPLTDGVRVDLGAGGSGLADDNGTQEDAS